MDNFELGKLLLRKLNERFPGITAVTSPIMDPGMVNHYLVNRDIKAFEFFLGSNDRYFCFAMESGNEILLTRPKEGVMTHLARSLRTKDFMYSLDGVLGSRNDFITKFIETTINRIAQAYIETTIIDNIYDENDNLMLNFTYGFKVTSVNYNEATYTADVEFTLKHVNKESWYTFIGMIRENVWVTMRNQDTKKVFSDIKDVVKFMLETN